jgi:ADP-ribose pyrophosphatase
VSLPDDPPPFAPFRVQRSERLYASRWCALRRDFIELPDGSVGEHHVFEVPDAAVVVPVLGSGELVLIGQFRHPHGRTCWEVPAGRLAAGETPERAARRELREESGCEAGRLVPLPGFYPINGISDHWVHAFAALDCRRTGGLELEATERIVPRVFSPPEVRALLAAGRIVDGFSALALHHYFAFVAPSGGAGADDR